MNIQQALEHAHSSVLPGFITGDTAITEERRRNEDCVATLMSAWKTSKAGEEPCDFATIMQVADRNRELCDSYGIERLERVNGSSLQRTLSDSDFIRAVAVMQQRSFQKVQKTAGPALQDLSIAYREATIKPISILGVDLETTSRFPDRGYIINLGMEFIDLREDSDPRDGHSAYFGMPDLYAQKGVPLAQIHHITWDNIAGKTPFRQETKIQEALLHAFCTFPIMAHNAAFEDSWFMLHLNGYAQARKEGKIVVIDSRDICRRCDPEIKSLPRESRPAALESWARRRKTLVSGEKEKHLGLEDVDLMFRTVQAEFKEREMFA